MKGGCCKKCRRSGCGPYDGGALQGPSAKTVSGVFDMDATLQVILEALGARLKAIVIAHEVTCG